MWPRQRPTKKTLPPLLLTLVSIHCLRRIEYFNFLIWNLFTFSTNSTRKSNNPKWISCVWNFALMMKHVSLQLVRLSHHSVACCALSTLARRVHTCWLRCVCNPEVVCYTVMRRHEAQRCKQLRHTTPRKTTHTRRSSCTSAETCSSQTDQQRECACVLIRRHVRLTRLCPLRGRALASVPPRHRQERLQSGLQ